MSNMRHNDPIVRGYAVTHPIGEVQLPTQPGWDQIIYAKSGLLIARTDTESWTVPPHRAICVADGTRIRLKTRRRTAVRCLYLRSHLGATASPIRVVSITPFTRELLLHTVDACPLGLVSPVDAALVTLLVDQIAAQPSAPLQLPLPGDDRARQMAEIVLADPAITIDAAVSGVGASRRTLERLFRSETQMTLAGWQRRARVLAAIELMADTLSVTRTAALVGYATPSSFVAAFKSELGFPPRAFMTVGSD